MSKKNQRKTQPKKSYTHLFTNDFLTALANWQRGWSENQDKRRELADILVEQCKSLPEKFKHVNVYCYRKRFLLEGEIVPIVLYGQLSEGIASWTTGLDFAKMFKRKYKENTKFTVVFKHKPKKGEVILSIVSLWKNKDFIESINKFRIEQPEIAEAIFNFSYKQSEVILRSTLRGDEIEDIVGKSHSFEDICDMQNIPEDEREIVSKRYAKIPNAIPIEELVFAGAKATKRSIQITLAKMKAMLTEAELNNIPIIWPNTALVHEDDLKHKLD